MLHDDGFAAHGLKRLAQADDTGFGALGDADVDEDYMVGPMIDQSVEACNQFRVAAPAQAALEHGELHPLAVALHLPEHAAPPFGVGDVVDDDVEMLHGALLVMVKSDGPTLDPVPLPAPHVQMAPSASSGGRASMLGPAPQPAPHGGPTVAPRRPAPATTARRHRSRPRMAGPRFTSR